MNTAASADLRALAIDAVKTATAESPDTVKLRAIKLVLVALKGRGRMEGSHLRVAKDAVEWALDHPAAADLPDGSIVVGRNEESTREVVCIKNHPTATSPWRCTDGSYAGDWFIDGLLGDGGTVLRVGTGA